MLLSCWSFDRESAVDPEVIPSEPLLPAAGISSLGDAAHTRRCTQLASNVLSPSWLSSPSVGMMLLMAFQAEELHLLLLPGCNHVRWATLALHSPSKSMRMMHDESQTGSSAALALPAFGCVQPLSLLVA